MTMDASILIYFSINYIVNKVLCPFHLSYDAQRIIIMSYRQCLNGVLVNCNITSLSVKSCFITLFDVEPMLHLFWRSQVKNSGLRFASLLFRFSNDLVSRKDLEFGSVVSYFLFHCYACGVAPSYVLEY